VVVEAAAVAGVLAWEAEADDLRWAVEEVEDFLAELPR
jgi:hypothetical protein